jgi:hypothetical protein
MRSTNQAQGEGRTASGGQDAQALPGGAYLTDGKALFRVERTLVDGPNGELFVELEDCATLELIFCSARSIAELDFRVVQPALRQLAVA